MTAPDEICHCASPTAVVLVDRLRWTHLAFRDCRGVVEPGSLGLSQQLIADIKA